MHTLEKTFITVVCRSAHVRKQFEINVFGPMDVTTAFLPHLRSSTMDPTLVVIGSRSAWKTELVVGVATLRDFYVSFISLPGKR